MSGDTLVVVVRETPAHALASDLSVPYMERMICRTHCLSLLRSPNCQHAQVMHSPPLLTLLLLHHIFLYSSFSPWRGRNEGMVRETMYLNAGCSSIITVQHRAHLAVDVWYAFTNLGTWLDHSLVCSWKRLSLVFEGLVRMVTSVFFALLLWWWCLTTELKRYPEPSG